MEKKEYSIEIGGKTLTAEFNDLTNSADGSVMLKYGNTVVLATAVMSSNKRAGINYFPLTVDYDEKFYAAGRILGSRFMRREGRPSDEAVLSGRAIDRTLRPLFNQSTRNEVQVVTTILSIDEDDPDVLAITAASLALATSDIPWAGPVSAVRIGRKTEGDFVVNPNYEFREADDTLIDVVACGRDGNINMIEIESKEASETLAVDALKEASIQIEKLNEFQEMIIKEIGKEKRVVETISVSDEVKSLFEKEMKASLVAGVFNGPGKDSINKTKDEWKNILLENLPDENVDLAIDYFEEKVDEALHTEALESDKRTDGRKMDEVREIQTQVGGISPILHGTGIFYRGSTHILSVLTLGGPDDSQIVEGMEVRTKRTFMHHYNFPPFSVGETGRMGGMNRRAIGHGALAEKAVKAILPNKDKFPYTIRIVSEVLESNGSSSMGSVCGSSLALMDAGVPIKSHVAGIAMGLVLGDDNNYKILTDIQGPEDHHGDMDFKVAGTTEGITAVQMDVKVGGIPVEILREAFEKAKDARLHILENMNKTIPTPKEEISPNAPHIVVMQIKPDQIREVIGAGGKVINKIREDTDTEISIEDDGTIFITGKDGGAESAKVIIEDITRVYVKGDRFDAVVTKITDFGIFAKLGRGAEGLVHISEIAPFRINKIEGIINEGDVVPVVVREIDDRGRISLSIKSIDPDFAKKKGFVEGTSTFTRNNDRRPNK